MYDSTWTANGRYLVAGQGSGKSRLEFEFLQLPKPFRLTQIRDGRFYYGLKEADGQPTLEFLNLEQAASKDQDQLLGTAASWNSIGGVSSLLLRLADAFDFEEVGQGAIGDIAVYHLRGSWNREFLARLLIDQVDPAWLKEPVQWHRLPQKQLPHSVEIWLGNDRFLPLFPYRIELYQFQQPVSELNSPKLNRNRIVTLDMNRVKKLKSLPEETFRPDTERRQLLDQTDEVVHRIERLNRDPVLGSGNRTASADQENAAPK
jgi:hypothetical protein